MCISTISMCPRHWISCDSPISPVDETAKRPREITHKASLVFRISFIVASRKQVPLRAHFVRTIELLVPGRNEPRSCHYSWFPSQLRETTRTTEANEDRPRGHTVLFTSAGERVLSNAYDFRIKFRLNVPSTIKARAIDATCPVIHLWKSARTLNSIWRAADSNVVTNETRKKYQSWTHFGLIGLNVPV